MNLLNKTEEQDFASLWNGTVPGTEPLPSVQVTFSFLSSLVLRPGSTNDFPLPSIRCYQLRTAETWWKTGKKGLDPYICLLLVSRSSTHRLHAFKFHLSFLELLSTFSVTILLLPSGFPGPGGPCSLFRCLRWITWDSSQGLLSYQHQPSWQCPFLLGQISSGVWWLLRAPEMPAWAWWQPPPQECECQLDRNPALRV